MFTGEALIPESLQIFLFGMAGIFVVMSIIITTVLVLSRFGKKVKE